MLPGEFCTGTHTATNLVPSADEATDCHPKLGRLTFVQFWVNAELAMVQRAQQAATPNGRNCVFINNFSNARNNKCYPRSNTPINLILMNVKENG